jgi:hypothetical protein
MMNFDETSFQVRSPYMQQPVDRGYTYAATLSWPLLPESDQELVVGSEWDDMPEMIDLSDSDDGEYLFSVVG